MIDGVHACVIEGNGTGYNWKGQYPLSMQEAFARGYNLRPHDLSYPFKMVTMFGQHMKRNYQNKFYAKAQNLARHLKEKYNSALKEFDILVMPTLKQLPPKLPMATDDTKKKIKLTVGLNGNTSHFNVTGNPALTIRAGYTDGFPVGMMIVGGMFDEVTVLQMARTFEKIVNV